MRYIRGAPVHKFKSFYLPKNTSKGAAVAKNTLYKHHNLDRSVSQAMINTDKIANFLIFSKKWQKARRCSSSITVGEGANSYFGKAVFIYIIFFLSFLQRTAFACRFYLQCNPMGFTGYLLTYHPWSPLSSPYHLIIYSSSIL